MEDNRTQKTAKTEPSIHTHLEVLHFVKKLEQLGDRVVLLAPADQKGIGWRLSMPQASSAELIQVDLGKIEQVKTF